MTAPYERLVELARRQRMLVEEGRLDELGAVASAWGRLTEALPGTPPREAEPYLREADLLVRSAAAALAQTLDDTRTSLDHLARGRRAVVGYGGAARPALERVG